MLAGEERKATLRPHPFSWSGTYLVAGLPALWGLTLAWMWRTEWWQTASEGEWWQVWTWLYGNTVSAHVHTLAGLALLGAIVSVMTIRWRRFWLYLFMGLLAVGATIATRSDATVTIPVALVALSLPALAYAELDRRSHRYHLTNLRIVFQGGTFVRRERSIKFEAITDLDGTQGPLGGLLDYGTLIPVTQSGFGLGNDTSQASVAVGAGGGKGGLFGGAAVTAGGGKEVSVGRARTFHQLTGIRPYGDTKHLLEQLIQEATSTPYLREQVELQKSMVDALNRMSGKDDQSGAQGSSGESPTPDGPRAF